MHQDTACNPQFCFNSSFNTNTMAVTIYRFISKIQIRMLMKERFVHDRVFMSKHNETGSHSFARQSNCVRELALEYNKL